MKKLNKNIFLILFIIISWTSLSDCGYQLKNRLAPRGETLSIPLCKSSNSLSWLPTDTFTHYLRQIFIRHGYSLTNQAGATTLKCSLISFSENALPTHNAKGAIVTGIYTITARIKISIRLNNGESITNTIKKQVSYSQNKTLLFTEGNRQRAIKEVAALVAEEIFSNYHNRF